MGSLDVLDYVTRLDEALATHTRSAGLRRAALRDARRLIDALAFRFALLDERPLPEDLDYLRAIEAMKEPRAAAAVLARRLPTYAKQRRRRLATTWSILLVVALLFGGLAYLATSEKAEELASVSAHPAVDVQHAYNESFDVDGGITRLHVDGSVFLARDTNGSVEIRLYRTDNATGAITTAMVQDYYPRGDNYLRFNVEAPAPGRWTLLVDFDQAHGSVDVTVDGIRPTRA